MRRLTGMAAISLGAVWLWTGAARGQFGRSAGDWMTSGSDAQRSSWVRSDPKISKDSMQKPGFALVWKVKLGSDVEASNAGQPILLTRYIGYRGFRSLAFVGAGADNVFGIDTDLGRIEWRKRLSPGARGCGGAVAVTRPTEAAFPASGMGFGGFGGRGGPARSGVGKPGEGAVTLAQVGANAAFARPPRRPPPGAPGARNAPAPGGYGFGRTPTLVDALTSDGMLHAMYVSSGEEPQPPAPFVPANTTARGLIVVDGVAYAATGEGCGGAPDGVRALDLAAKEVASWKSGAGSIAGADGPAVGPDGTLYVATTGGELAALEPKTLKLKSTYTAQAEFAASPAIFEYKQKTLIAVAAKDGRIHLLDAAAPQAALSVSQGAGNITGALASWQDLAGTHWILAPGDGGLVAWKVIDQNGAPALEEGWRSRAVSSALATMVVNGVIFAVSGGGHAVLYALDAGSGKELWSSGNTIASAIAGGISGGGSQVYLGTADGTLYAFGFPIEH